MGASNNGVIRVSRKGRAKFAVGAEEDERALPVFDVDVVVAFQRWISIDEGFRPPDANDDGGRPIADGDMPEYHKAAVAFVEELGGEKYVGKVETAEALDLIARLREQYDGLAAFFRPRLRPGPGSPGTSEEGSGTGSAPTSTRFSQEPA